MPTRRTFMLSAAACIAASQLGANAQRGFAAEQKRTGDMPINSCDCHVHVIGPQDRYPMLPNREYTPPEASVTELRGHLSSLRLSRVVLIQPSFYGTDNRCLTDSLKQLGDSARGIAVIDEKTSDEELQNLAQHGVKGARVNLESIGKRDPTDAHNALTDLASRIAPLHWHIQIYASSNVIASSAQQIADLPVPVSLDHFAMLKTSVGIKQPDAAPILDLVRSGHAYIKLSAPYRVSKDTPDYENVKPFAQAFIKSNPERILWASDWPHTDRKPGAKPTDVSPFRKINDNLVLEQLNNWAPSTDILHKILVENPARLYGFD